MNKNNTIRVLTCLIGLWAAGGAAAALAPARFAEQAYGECGRTEDLHGQNDAVPEIVNVDLSTPVCQAISDVFTAGVVNDPFISIQLHASGTARAQGFGDIGYAMQVNGPPGTFVPVRVTAAFNINGILRGTLLAPNGLPVIYAEGSAIITGLPTGPMGACTWWGFRPLGCQNGPEGGTSDAVNQVMDLYVGSQIHITMQGFARVGVTKIDESAPLSEIDLVVDPHFEFVNPDDALLYSFEFSPNMTPVPAPGAAWLFVTGLGLLGSRLQKRRQFPGTAQ